MRSAMGLLGLLVALVVGLFVYRSYVAAPGGVSNDSNNPRAAADLAGVKNDLLSMAQAERAYRALNGRYAALEELRSSGDLLIDPARERQGYVYSAAVSNDHFTITATYTGPAVGMPTLSIDETMEIAER